MISVWVANSGIGSQCEFGGAWVKLSKLHHSETPLLPENIGSFFRPENGLAPSQNPAARCFLNSSEPPNI